MNFRDKSIALRFLIDILSVSLAFVLALWLSHGDAFELPHRRRDVLHWIILLLSWFQFAEHVEYYNGFRHKNVTHDILSTLRMTVILIFIYAIVAFLVDTGGDERLGFLIFAVVLFPALFLRKYLFRRLSIAFKTNSRDRVVFVGHSSVSQEISDTMRRRPWMGYSVMGGVEVEKNTYLVEDVIRELKDLIHKAKPNRVFVDEKSLRRADLDSIVSECMSHTVHPFVLPEGLKFYSERYQVQFFDDIPIVAVRKNPLERLRYKVVKRVVDILFSGILLLTALPIVFLIISVIIKLNSKGPIFFVQERWGMNNVPFKALKFRSMSNQSQDVVAGKYQQAERNDARITKVGAFLRKTNLDELPQFLNVLLGDMSVVGPRPHPEPLNLESKDIVNNYLQRHLVKPGITGWAQVNGARGETKKVSQMQKRVDYDIWYIENWSFMLDIRIIFQTVWNMYKGEKHAF
ncbi:MAG: putative colanic acid biosynthesis UDP-glucose lipid carrier transferase [Bacteroidia bacterium]|jgi:putative colanic acid biosynthesis UDP-glucose lipid carrier transferase